MRFIEVLKRVGPFLASFVIGLFVASLFVSLSAPTVRSDRSWKNEGHGDYHRLKRQNRCLMRENRRLKRERLNIEEVEVDFDEVMELVPPPPAPPMAPAPPIAPVAPPPRVR